MNDWLYDLAYYDGIVRRDEADETAKRVTRFDEQGFDPDHFYNEEPELFRGLFCSIYFEEWQARFWQLHAERATDEGDFQFRMRLLVAAGCARFRALQGALKSDDVLLIQERCEALLGSWRLERNLPQELRQVSESTEARVRGIEQQENSADHETAMQQADRDLEHERTLKLIQSDRDAKLEGLRERKRSLLRQIEDEKAKASAAAQETKEIQQLLDQFPADER